MRLTWRLKSSGQLSHPQQLQHMRREARAVFEARYTGQANYRQLMDIYDQARAR